LLLNYTITVAVAYNSNPGSLDNLEKLILQILAVIPSGYVVGQIERPTVTSVGASNLLAADINVSTYYTQTN
jgi:secreted protein with Ig-like and vWFA domain